MAIKVMSSFDYSTSLAAIGFTATGGAYVIPSTDKARTGAQSLKLACYAAFGITGQGYFTITGNPTTVWAQMALYCDYMPNISIDDDQYGVLWFAENGNIHIRIGFDPSTGQVVVARGYSGPPGIEIVRSSQSGLFTYSTWVHIEATVKVHDSTGTVKVKINGAEVINATGLDTRYGGSGYINQVFVAGGSWQNGWNSYVDDFIAGDTVGEAPTAAPGDCRVEYLRPIGAGSKTEFTPLSSTNWGNVDDLGSSNDSDYNSSPNTGATDTFAMANLTGSGIVHAVQTVIRARKDDVGFRKIRPAFYMGNGVGDTPRLYGGLDVAVGDSFAQYRQIWTTSPDTGVAWTVDEVAGLEAGYAVGGGSQFGVDAWIAAF